MAGFKSLSSETEEQAGHTLSPWMRLWASGNGKDGRSDADLLESFIDSRDQQAFATLMHRHGPMVLGLCQRMLQDPHAAEDAFQATFLVLFRRASSLSQRELLANWLFGVAYRTARSVQRKKRWSAPLDRELKDAKSCEPVTGAMAKELQDVLDEELYKLPAHFRQAILLCYFQNYTYTQAAEILGCP